MSRSPIIRISIFCQATSSNIRTTSPTGSSEPWRKGAFRVSLKCGSLFFPRYCRFEARATPYHRWQARQTPGTQGCNAGDEFYFSDAITLVFPAGVRAQNLAEFVMGLKYVDKSSIYYHFYEARMRLRNGTDDFSTWFLKSLGLQDLAQEMKALDPFMHTLEGIRGHVIKAVEDKLREDMEACSGDHRLCRNSSKG